MATYCQVECKVNKTEIESRMGFRWNEEGMVFPEHKEGPPLIHHHGLQTFFQLLSVKSVLVQFCLKIFC